VALGVGSLLVGLYDPERDQFVTVTKIGTGLSDEQWRLFRNTDLVIPKEGTPGTTAEHEGLYQGSLGLNGVIQIVSGSGMKHLCQRDGTQLRMPYGPSQVFIPHVLEQDKAFLTSECERSRELLRSL
jgi:hypothetical protein